jgi:adenylate cyclase 10
MAIQSALEVHHKLGHACIYSDINLSVKIGFGYGKINIIYVGGVFGRAEYLATGEPLV